MITRYWDARDVDVIDLSISLRYIGVETLFGQVVKLDYNQQAYRLHVSIELVM